MSRQMSEYVSVYVAEQSRTHVRIYITLLLRMLESFSVRTNVDFCLSLYVRSMSEDVSHYVRANVEIHISTYVRIQ